MRTVCAIARTHARGGSMASSIASPSWKDLRPDPENSLWRLRSAAAPQPHSRADSANTERSVVAREPAFKGRRTRIRSGAAYIGARSQFVGVCGMSFRPRDLADRMARRAGAPDGFVRETFALPREEARAKARAFL